MTIEDFIKNFAEQFEDTDASKIIADTNFTDLDEWSSLTTISVIAMIKTEYDKNVTGSEIRKCKTVKDLFNLVASK
jgi:acyl carrier protein